MKSPYLWSFSNHYSRGKYVADGRFDPDAADAQCGALPIVKRIMELHASARFADAAFKPVGAGFKPAPTPPPKSPRKPVPPPVVIGPTAGAAGGIAVALLQSGYVKTAVAVAIVAGLAVAGYLVLRKLK